MSIGVLMLLVMLQRVRHHPVTGTYAYAGTSSVRRRGGTGISAPSGLDERDVGVISLKG